MFTQAAITLTVLNILVNEAHFGLFASNKLPELFRRDLGDFSILEFSIHCSEYFSICDKKHRALSLAQTLTLVLIWRLAETCNPHNFKSQRNTHERIQPAHATSECGLFLHLPKVPSFPSICYVCYLQHPSVSVQLTSC